MEIINIELYSIGFDATFQHEELCTMSKFAILVEQKEIESATPVNLT